MKKIIVFLIIIFFIIISSFLYMNIKKQTVVKEVQEYLIEEKGVEKTDIIDLEPIISNLSGNKNILVYVKLKNDNKKYYYYKDNNNIILHSYTLDSKEKVIN